VLKFVGKFALNHFVLDKMHNFVINDANLELVTNIDDPESVL
jgi:hypothetical protein